MKFNYLRLLSFLIIAAFAQACWNDEPTPPQKTAEELAIEALTETGRINWVIAGGGTVKRDGNLVTDLYQNFELNLSANTAAKTYTSKNNNDIFDNAGTWSFAGSNFDKIILTGSQPVSGREISFTRNGDRLILIFTIPLPGARINGVQAIAGTYEFDLLKD